MNRHLLSLSLLFLTTPASAQLSERVAAPVAPRGSNLISFLPPAPDEACVFTDENFKGVRYCFKAQENMPLPDGLSKQISSFLIPYGYELSLFERTLSDTGYRPPHILCRVIQIDANVSYNGTVRLNGGCTADPAADNRATSASFRKMPNITDAQRKAAWRKWPAVDDRSCAVKLWPRFASPQDKITQRFDEMGRDFCFGTFFDMNNIAEYRWSEVPSTINWKILLGGVLIRSRTVQVRLFEKINLGGLSVTLTCGRHELGFLMQKVSSADITILSTPVASCPDAPQSVATWDPTLVPTRRP
jgi:hypothetical protein